MLNHFDDCTLDPDACDSNATLMLHRLDVTGAVIDLLMMLGYLTVMIFTCCKETGKSIPLLQAMLALSCLLHLLAYTPELNSKPFQITVRWTI